LVEETGVPGRNPVHLAMSWIRIHNVIDDRH
jgi:hypothetical protein